MKKNLRAILYIRVSTDDQIDGYSLGYQEEQLRRYCELRGIEIVEFYSEDYSAKTFAKRPEFTKLLNGLKKRRGKADLILFTKWDRFSRNTGDAYAMISTLDKLGVEAQAIEQPIDMSIPENKIMLAFYLASPEVENHRRALNVFGGMRRAKKAGRCMGSAPKGYKNVSFGEGKDITRLIVPSDDAPTIKWAFEEIAKNIHHVDDIRKGCNMRGLKCSKNNFWHLIRNPLYYGKLVICAYKDEEEYLADGIHEPLISEELFRTVQDILTGRGRKKKYKISIKDELPLRGFLSCVRCGKKLSGSASTGGSGIKHFYYHCTKGCPERSKAHELNNSFSVYLKNITFKPEVHELYDHIIKEVLNVKSEAKSTGKKQTEAEIQANRERIRKAQQMMLDGEISASDYHEIKKRYEPLIDQLEREYLKAGTEGMEFKRYLRKGLEMLKRLDYVYDTANITNKQLIIRSVCRENLQFEKNEVRTGITNRLFELITSIGGRYRGNKKGTESTFASQSHEVIPLGFEPRTPSLKVMCSTS
jgi:site-specific DNA recombinase